jgi:hypothetical protein
MRVELIKDPEVFWNKCGDFLLGHEVENNISIGLTQNLMKGIVKKGFEDFKSIVVWNDRNEVIGSFITSGRDICISYPNNPECFQNVLDVIVDDGWVYPAVSGESELAEKMAVLVNEKTGREIDRKINMIVHKLVKVDHPQNISGYLRAGTMDDIELFADWVFHFSIDANLPEKLRETREQAKDTAELYMKNKMVWFWCDEQDQPVSVACKTRELVTAANVSRVYTPKKFRGKGYASACVAAVSQHLLDNGFDMVSLYTDAANPTSNKIYFEVGYRPVLSLKAINFID